jgi:hypothetical protein
MEERRRVPRIVFGGVAELSVPGTFTPVIAQATSLSRFGCLVKTTARLPQGSKLILKLTCNGREFTASGEALYTQAGMGTAIAFGIIAGNGHAVLAHWLSEGASEPSEPRLRTALLDDFPVELTCPTCKQKTWTKIAALKEQTAYTFPCGHTFGTEILLKDLPSRNADWSQ